MRRPDWIVLAGWPFFLAAELWVAAHGFRTPSPAQVATEVLGWAVIALTGARLLPTGWLRSPLWAGALPLAWTLLLLGPRGGQGLLHLVGLVVVTAFLVRWADTALRVGALGGILAGLVGAGAARLLVLDKAGSGGAGRQTSVARSPLARLQRELSTVPWRAAPAPTSDGPPIVLITVDTLRADHGAEMLAYRRLAARGVVFDQAVSTSSWTVPAVASALTGLPPSEHGAGVGEDGQLHGLSADAPTLAEALAAEGYATAAFTTNAWLTSTLGFARGFQDWNHGDEDFHHMLALAGFPKGPPARSAEAVVQAATAWVRAAPPQGYLLWVHLLDPHLPYVHATGSFEAGLSDERLRSGMRLNAEAVDKTRAAYAHEVAAVDAALTALLDALDAHAPGAVIALTADHGEELWEHGATGHGHSHHREVVQIPMVLSAPGLSPGRVEAPVSLLDVPTTLAAIAGHSFGQGADLLADADPDRLVTTHGNAYFWTQRSAWGRGGRAIVSARDEVATCYHHGVDPGEQVPMPCPPGDDLAATASAVRGPSGGAVPDLPIEALRALGYL